MFFLSLGFNEGFLRFWGGGGEGTFCFVFGGFFTGGYIYFTIVMVYTKYIFWGGGSEGLFSPDDVTRHERFKLLYRTAYAHLLAFSIPYNSTRN